MYKSVEKQTCQKTWAPCFFFFLIFSKSSSDGGLLVVARDKVCSRYNEKETTKSGLVTEYER